MASYTDILITAIAPIAWGSTYLVTSELLPEGYPITVAMLRALPVGLLMLLLLREWPTKSQWLKVFILGGFNFTIFWICLFISAYRLPGGVAATLGAIQPMFVIGLSYKLLHNKITPRSMLSALAGIIGVSLLVLKSNIALDFVGIAAALSGAASMALGTVLTKRWRGNVSLLVFTSWQLSAGGILLLPLCLIFEPNFPHFDSHNIMGLIWLGLIGALLSYVLWFRGIALLDPVQVSILGFLSPVAAILLGWCVLGQSLNIFQLVGVTIILISILSNINIGVKNTCKH